MKNDELLIPIKAKIDRAKEHFQSLRNGSPFEMIRSENTEGDIVYSLKLTQSLEKLGTVIGDILHNTRSALDILVSQLLIANGNFPTDDSSFPVDSTSENFISNSPRKIIGISDEAKEMIEDIKPYKDGNLLLWQLHKLNIRDKHKLIIPVFSRNTDVILEPFAEISKDFPSIALTPASYETPLVDGSEIYRTKKKDEIPPKALIEPFLPEVEGITGLQPLFPILQKFIDLVENIVGKFHPLLIK